MNTATVLWLITSILFSAAVLESFLAVIDSLRPRAAKTAIYLATIVIWIFGPIYLLEAASHWLSAFGEIDKVTWLGLWFATLMAHFSLRGRRTAESMWRAIW